MRSSAKLLLLGLATVLIAIQAVHAQAPSPGPSPANRTSACTLPNGVEVVAPEQTGTSTQYYYYYYSYSWTYYSTYYVRYYYYGRKLLQTVGAPAPSSAPRCCPTITTKQGDTVSSLISAAALPSESKVFFYTINPSVQNGTDTLPAGSVVTVPCFRITEFYRLAATNAQAPGSAAATG